MACRSKNSLVKMNQGLDFLLLDVLIFASGMVVLRVVRIATVLQVPNVQAMTDLPTLVLMMVDPEVVDLVMVHPLVADPVKVETTVLKHVGLI